MKAVDGRRVVSEEYDHINDEYCQRLSSKRPYQKGVSEGRLKWWCIGFERFAMKAFEKNKARVSAMEKLRKTILAKKVQEWKEKKNIAAIVEEIPPVQATSEPKEVTIDTPPAAPEPEEKTEETLAVPEPDALTIEEPPAAPEPEPQAISYETTRSNTEIIFLFLLFIVRLITIAPEALTKPTLKIINAPEASPKPTPKIIDEYPAESKPDPPPPAARASDTGQDIKEVQEHADPRSNHRTHRPKVKMKEVERILATSKGDHQLVTSKGGKIYRGMTGWLKGCVGFSNATSQPTYLVIVYIGYYWRRARTRIGKEDVGGMKGERSDG